MQKVLLLNPPGQKNYIRDYYCSKTSKSGYSYTPVDFLYISAHLKNHFELFFIDGIIKNISVDALLTRMREFSPDIVVVLTGYVSWREDFELFRRIKCDFPNIRLIGSGDVLLNLRPEILMRESHLDAILYDFSCREILDYCLDGRSIYRDIVYKNQTDQIILPTKTNAQDEKEFEIDVPPHQIFPLDIYEYPFVRRRPFATVLTDFSCPHRCNFCIMSQLRYKYRKAENVLAELDYLKEKGVKDIYFADQTFGAHKKNIKELLERMVERKYRFGWVCFSRVDVMKEEMLRLMKKAGCHTIIFGVEFGNDENLTVTSKNINRDEIIQTLKLCREHKIRTVGTFLLGEPTQTKKDVEDLIRFSTELDLDFASFNVYVPRVKGSLKEGETLSDLPCYDQSGGIIKSFSPHLTDQELADYHRLALKKFYLRMAYLAKRFISLRSSFELKILLREGIQLGLSIFRK